MYEVIFLRPTSPKELEKILNNLNKEHKLELVAVDGGYYIFKKL